MQRSLRLVVQAGALALVAGLLALLVWKLTHQQGGGAAAALAHGRTPTAPNFTLSRLGAPGKLELASLRGKVVVLNFWASWCVPCKAEAPHFEAAWRRWRGRGVVVVGVDVNDVSSDARRFARRYGLTYPLLHDGSGKTLGPYGVALLPETFVIRRDGKLLGERILGQLGAEELEASIRRAVAS